MSFETLNSTTTAPVAPLRQQSTPTTLFLFRRVLLGAVGFGLLSCVLGAQLQAQTRPASRPASQPGTRPASQPAVKLQPAPELLDVGDVKLKPNRGWKLRPTSGEVRRAELVLPAPQGADDGSLASEAGEIIVYYFGSDGAGDAKSNLIRWKGMFARPAEITPEDFAQESSLEANGMKVTTLTVKGSYLGPSFDPLPHPLHGHMMMAAVIETANGPYYLRALGSRETLEHWRKAWLEMLKTLEPTKG